MFSLIIIIYIAPATFKMYSALSCLISNVMMNTRIKITIAKMFLIVIVETKYF